MRAWANHLSLLAATVLIAPIMAVPTRAAAQSGAQAVAACGTPNITMHVGGTYPTTQDTTGTLCTKGSSGGGGAVTLAAGSVSSGAYVAGSIGAGAISDLGTGASPAANTVNANLLQIDADVRAPLAAGTNTIGNVGLNAGSNLIGGVNVLPTTAGGLSVKSYLVPNNTTSVAIDASPGQVYGIAAYAINASAPVFLKLYNAAQGSTTCGSGTPVERHLVSTQATGAGVAVNLSPGVAYGTAITACVTTGIADADTGAPTASNYIINVYYK